MRGAGGVTYPGSITSGLVGHTEATRMLVLCLLPSDVGSAHLRPRADSERVQVHR